MEKINTLEETFAVVIGVLARDEGKIQMSKFNKIISEFGLEKLNMMQIKDMVNQVREDKHLNSLKDRAILGEITLNDLQDIKGETVFEGNNYQKAVSNYIVENEKTLSHLREIRKANREGAQLQILMDDLKESMKQEISKGYISPIVHRGVKVDSDKHMLVLISDFHVGAINSDYTHGGYNFDILVSRVEQFLNSVFKTFTEQEDIQDVTIYFVGDLVEHISMRDVNQAFETEFTLAEQIAKGTRLLLDIIQSISKEVSGKVRFGMVGGNHDRLQGNKNQKIYNDNVAYIVLDSLLLMQEQGLLNGVEIIDNREDVYTIREDIFDKKIVVNHGDSLKGKGSHIPKFIIDENIDLLITGHVHHFSARQEDFNRMHVVASSPMGYNNYAKELLLSRTQPSQQIIVLDKYTKDIDVKTVFLD